jgi:hypothetical protein
MGLPGFDELPGLLGWEPEHGIVSIYLRVDHADRGGGWWIALEDELRRLLERTDDDERELRLAVRDTVERVRARFGDRDRAPEARGVVGFLEVSRSNGRDAIHTSLAAPRRAATAQIAPRPFVQPLLEVLDENRRRGAVAISGERARLFEWEEATVGELAMSEMTTTGDWRERKGQRNFDVPSVQATSSSGKDLHEQRLDHHRHGFVKTIAERVRTSIADRGWEGVVLFGEPKQLSELEAELPAGSVLHADRKNLLPEPTTAVAERLEDLKDELNRRRELRLLDRAEEAALSGAGGSLGLAETAQALAMGRVAHLLIASEHLPPGGEERLAAALEPLGGVPGALPVAELMIERAIATDALVTPVEGAAADRLASREGAAAILRY